jgi:hypothetical protein
MKRLIFAVALTGCGGKPDVSDPKTCLNEVKKTALREGCELIGAGCVDREPDRTECLFTMRCPDGVRKDLKYFCLDIYP